jgi:FkbM family methyltransferase
VSYKNTHTSAPRERKSVLSSFTNLPPPTAWGDNPYQHDWAERDYLYMTDGAREFPKHPCKRTYQLSKPFIRNFRNAVDVGCRIGEFTRYLHLDFEHVYAFDARLWRDFRFNVDLSKVTHFTCALGNEAGVIEMFGGGHRRHRDIRPQRTQVFTLDMFDLPAIDYIKIDVEGFEKKVLLGAARTIERDSPLIVIEQNEIVLDGDHKYSAKEYLESIGYRQVAVDRKGWDFVMARV